MYVSNIIKQSKENVFTEWVPGKYENERGEIRHSTTSYIKLNLK